MGEILGILFNALTNLVLVALFRYKNLYMAKWVCLVSPITQFLLVQRAHVYVCVWGGGGGAEQVTTYFLSITMDALDMEFQV